MPKLNDTQAILLSTAAQRDSGSLLPLPATFADAGESTTRAIAGLIKRGLFEERETTDNSIVRRADGDLRFGLFITEAGSQAINVVPANAGQQAPPAFKPERQSKSAAVVELLKRDSGATLAELIEATGWLPHTTRAALTGLRKKGHAIERTKRGDDTCYRIAASA